jgi:hypothetical protein
LDAGRWRIVFARPRRNWLRDRIQQLELISSYNELCFDSLNPILSIDTKKRQLLGDFYRDGPAFTAQTIRAFDHDYPSFAEGHAIPHGLFDIKRNRGSVNLGCSCDTSEFACESIFQWWSAEGHAAWSRADAQLLLRDGGDSNSLTQSLFKQDLQALANRLGREIRVCHYWSYTSKFNPIEHRMFSHVTRACQGVIFKTVEQVRHYMAKAKTRIGLSVPVNVLDRIYKKGRRVAVRFKNTMQIHFDNVLPRFNYLVFPIPQ